jgi:hypothetical protein
LSSSEAYPTAVEVKPGAARLDVRSARRHLGADAEEIREPE